MSTAPMTVVYDGHCRFCTSSARALQRRLGTRRVSLLDLQAPGALDAYPAVTHDAAMQKMHVVLPDGRVFAGAEAAARIGASVRGVSWLAFVYYVPGIRQIADFAYRVIARRRYHIAGSACDGGTCHLHGT